MRWPLVVDAMQGMGDTVYQRPWIRELVRVRRQDVFVHTSWPQLLGDLPRVHCVLPTTNGLRTQAKNVEANPDLFVAGPVQAERIRVRYGAQEPGVSILSEVGNAFRIRRPRLVFDMPRFKGSPVRFKRPVAVLKPVTVRREWRHELRAPLAEYVAEASLILQDMGYAVVAVADVDDHREWFEGQVPTADRYFVKGELSFQKLMSLVQGAALLVGGVGWNVPVGIASRVPAVVIGGGCGGHNAPEVVTDPRMDLSRIRFVLPDRYCRCRCMVSEERNGFHRCYRTISDFAEKFTRAVESLMSPKAAVA